LKARRQALNSLLKQHTNNHCCSRASMGTHPGGGGFSSGGIQWGRTTTTLGRGPCCGTLLADADPGVVGGATGVGAGGGVTLVPVPNSSGLGGAGVVNRAGAAGRCGVAGGPAAELAAAAAGAGDVVCCLLELAPVQGAGHGATMGEVAMEASQAVVLLLQHLALGWAAGRCSSNRVSYAGSQAFYCWWAACGSVGRPWCLQGLLPTVQAPALPGSLLLESKCGDMGIQACYTVAAVRMRPESPVCSSHNTRSPATRCDSDTLDTAIENISEGW
jgi:hypothetical protein